MSPSLRRGRQVDSASLNLAWQDSGIPSKAPPWPIFNTIAGTVLGILGLSIVVLILLPVAILSAICEGLRYALGFEPYTTSFGEGRDEDIVFVLPGTCTYVFWQVGMVHYLCEHFDTKGAKIIGVSSGAICAGLFYALEKAADAGDVRTAAARVRERAHEVYVIVERLCKPIASWPLGFLCRLGSVLDSLAREVFPEDCVPGNRVRIGVRRLAFNGVPALVPDVITDFKSKADFETAILASSHVGLIVRPTPLRYIPQLKAYCSDGVNPFSLYCCVEYFQQQWAGIAARVMPKHTFNGLDIVYALWNCGTMRVLLPRRGHHLWITPTVGGNLDIRFSLRVSGWFIAEQWRRGYAHARELDAQKYWDPLPRRVPRT